MDAETSLPPKSNQRAVLLVDDDPVFVRSISRRLRAGGFSVDSFSTGSEAVNRVREGGIQVVVSDISMPGMSGLELLRRIREHDADLPVVLVTGIPAVESAMEAVDYGAFKYVVKPVDFQDLESTVERAIQLYRLARLKREALQVLGMTGRASDRVGLEASFARALSSLWIAFQPIVRAQNGAVFGYEALLRSGEASLPGPGDVLDAAEQLGQLDRLGRAVRARAAAPLETAPGEALLFVNLHPQDLMDPELGMESCPVTAVAGRVVLEITERASLGNLETVRARVAELRALGFRIAVDDLGAGYAGLTSFAHLEPDVVKIDMTLVRDIDKNPVKRRLVRSMTSLCQDMGLLIVAEGVETAAERDVLVELGCDLLQGYLFAKPGPPFPEVRWG